MTGNFKERLESRVLAGSFLCVGLDPTLEDRRKLHNPNAVGDVVEHLSGIVRATAPYAAAFKPNRAFYDGMGRMGDEVLRRVVDHIRFYHPDIPVILDNKLGDIATTNNGYVAMADLLGVDAMTLGPYLGSEAMEPFLSGDRYSFVLCKTSNAGSSQFQDVEVVAHVDGRTGYTYATREEYVIATGDDMLVHLVRETMPMFEYVAERVGQDWQRGGGAGLVVGATYPDHLLRVLDRVAGMVILIPGVGTQGGDPAKVFDAADDNLLLVNVSSAITKASDPAEAARAFNAKIAGWMTPAAIN